MMSAVRQAALRILIGTLAGIPTLANAAEPIEHSFRIEDDTHFAPVRTTLEALLVSSARTETNHLCVIGQTEDDGSRQAWVYWREANALILWEPTTGGMRDLTLSSRYLRLARDSVPPDDKRLAAGSSYLVSSAWTKSIIAECAASGTKFVIGRRQAASDLKKGKHP